MDFGEEEVSFEELELRARQETHPREINEAESENLTPVYFGGESAPQSGPPPSTNPTSTNDPIPPQNGAHASPIAEDIESLVSRLAQLAGVTPEIIRATLRYPTVSTQSPAEVSEHTPLTVEDPAEDDSFQEEFTASEEPQLVAPELTQNASSSVGEENSYTADFPSQVNPPFLASSSAAGVSDEGLSTPEVPVNHSVAAAAVAESFDEDIEVEEDDDFLEVDFDIDLDKLAEEALESLSGTSVSEVSDDAGVSANEEFGEGEPEDEFAKEPEKEQISKAIAVTSVEMKMPFISETDWLQASASLPLVRQR